MTGIKSKSHLDALKSARMFIAFIGAIIFMRREVSNKDPTTINNPGEEEVIRTTGGAFAGMVTEGAY